MQGTRLNKMKNTKTLSTSPSAEQIEARTIEDSKD